MKENPSYHEWLHATEEERGDLWLYDPLYRAPSRGWEGFGREPTVTDGVRQLGQLTLYIIKYILIDKHQ